MKKIALILAGLVCGTTGFASSFLNWALYSNTTFTQTASGSYQAVFSNVDNTGVNATVTISGDGFSNAKIAWMNYGYDVPGYNGPDGWVAANQGLFVAADFATLFEALTVTVQFSQAVDGVSYGIYGLGVDNDGWQSSWGTERGFQSAVSNIEASYNGTAQEASVSAAEGVAYDFVTDSYYATTSVQNNGNATGNLSVSYNGPVDTFSFTFSPFDSDGNFKADPDAQSFGLGGISFGNVVASNPGENIPEPATVATLLGLVALGGAIVARRKRKA